MESHVKVDCLMTVVVCPYEGAGCTFHDKRINLKAHIEESSEDHLSKTWSELLKTKQELTEVKEMEGFVEEIQGLVETLQLDKKVMETSLQRNSKEISELKLSEKKLEVENISLRKEVTELGGQLAELKVTAATENRSLKELKELVQTMQTRLEDIAKDGLTEPAKTVKVMREREMKFDSSKKTGRRPVESKRLTKKRDGFGSFSQPSTVWGLRLPDLDEASKKLPLSDWGEDRSSDWAETPKKLPLSDWGEPPSSEWAETPRKLPLSDWGELRSSDWA